MAKWAIVIDGVVDTITFWPDRKVVVDPETNETSLGGPMDQYVEINADVFCGYITNGNGGFVPPPVAPISPSGVDVNLERDRRIQSGAVFPVVGYGAVPITGRITDQTALLGLLIKAQGAHASGISDPVMTIRDRDNVNHLLTPLQMIALVSAGMSWIEETMAVSWAMKDGEPPFTDGIPSDFATNPAYWP